MQVFYEIRWTNPATTNTEGKLNTNTLLFLSDNTVSSLDPPASHINKLLASFLATTVNTSMYIANTMVTQTVKNGHPWDQTRVSIQEKWPLIRGRGWVGMAPDTDEIFIQNTRCYAIICIL